MQCSHTDCKAHALRDDALCFQHSQKAEIVQKRRTARSKGGRSKNHVITYIGSIDSIDDLKAILLAALNELNSCGSGNLIGKSRAVGFLVKAAADLIIVGELEGRLARLEEAQRGLVGGEEAERGRNDDMRLFH